MKPVLLDSSCWIEFFADGPLADEVARHLGDPESLVVPTIVLYEVYKKIKAVKGEETALEAAAQLSKAGPVALTEAIALSAADLSLSLGLAMADAVIVATARASGARIVTLDADFADIPGATVLGGTSS